MRLRTIITVAALFCVPLPAQTEGLAWRATGDDGATIYLVGTIHAARESFYPLPAPIEAAFADADVLVVEVDVSRVDPRTAQRITSEHGMLPRSQALHELLGADTWKRAAAWARRVGVPERSLNRMQPWLAAVTLVAMEIQRLGLDPNLGMERHFAAIADDRDLEVVELESLAEQMQTLAGLSPRTQVAFFDQSMSTYEEFEQAVDRLVDSWRAGDVDAMTDIMESAFTEPELYEALMRRRNHAWLPEVERMLASTRVHFVAVGALHLVGEDGLVRLLEERGYRLERL